MPEHKQKHIALIVWLAVLILGASYNLISFGFMFSNSPLPQIYKLLIIGFLGFRILCYIALLRWKKWGFWGLCVVSVASVIFEFAIGANILQAAIISLSILGFTYVVLQIGEENKGWSQLE